MGEGGADRRLHRVDRDARPDPRRDRPLMAEEYSQRSGDEGAIRATPLPPGWDTAVDIDKPPATVPDPSDGGSARGAAGADRDDHRPLPRPPLGGAAGHARGAGGARLVLAAGHRPGGRGDAGDPRLSVLGGHVLRHAAHAAHRAALRVRVHQRRLPPAQRQGGLRRHRRGGARPGPGGRGGARVRVPGRVRHGPDGLGRRALRRPARRLRRPRAGGRHPRAAHDPPGPRARGLRLPAALGYGGARGLAPRRSRRRAAPSRTASEWEPEA